MSGIFDGRRRAAGRRLRGVLMLAATMMTTLAGSGIAADAGVLTLPELPTSAAGSGMAAEPSAVKVGPSLMRQLHQRGGRTDFVVEFQEHADLSAAANMDWSERGRYVHRTLRETAERSQAAVRDALVAAGADVESFWISNVMWVRNGSLAQVEAAAAFAQVKRIIEPPTVRPIEPVQPPMRETKRHGAGARAGIADNILRVGADRVWAQGTLGSGITVGVIDDGALYTHEALVAQYRGNLGGGVFDHDYNWFGVSPEPAALESAHGTHVLGTILGDDRDPDPAQRDRIGMAPGARWIGCNWQSSFGDPLLALLACGQFMLAPTQIDGENPDPDRRPHVVNNSWSEQNCNGSATDFYRDLVDAWIAAGIFPAFAVGNTTSCGLPQPPGLSTVSSPAALGASFAVGSTGNHDGQYAPHSLWGPTDDPSLGLPNHPDHRGHPLLKPQVVAPGVDIRSAMILDDRDYGTMTGTSMSTPHITGLVALMLEAGDCLVGDYAAIGGLIMQTARPVPYATGGEPPPGIGNVPNYATGWGEIDAPAAVNAAAAACGPTGFLSGTITDKQGSPVAGARIEVFIDESVRVYEATTDAEGRYVRRLPVNEVTGYHVRATAYGYLTAQEDGVRLFDGQTTTLNLSLPIAPMHTLVGRVTDVSTGWPLHARIRIAGSPLDGLWTDPVSGRYSVRLPEGSPFRFDVTTEIDGYLPQSIDLPTVSAAATLDIGLDADLARCAAPGYAYTGQVFNESFDSGALPPGWSTSSAGIGWLFGTADEVSSPEFLVPDHGLLAASNDRLGDDGGESNDGRYDYLVLPPQNLIGLDRPVLRYRSFHTFDSPESAPRPPAAVEASTDGGHTWTVLAAPTSTHADSGWTDDVADLSSVIGANVLIRFHADDLGTSEWGFLGSGWAIDDVSIRTGCTPPRQGGLVVGQVRDANTSVALNGVDVSVAGGRPSRTRTSADPGVGMGFYAVHDAGSGGVLNAQPSAALPVGYGDSQAASPAVSGDTVRLDLTLPAGRLRLYPSGPFATLELGTTTTTQFAIGNTGTLPLAFGLEGVALEEHFETAFPPDGWTLSNDGADCPWHWLDPTQSANFAGGDGRAAKVDLFPCENMGDVDTSLVTPAFDFTKTSTASIGFFLALLDGSDTHPQFDVEATTDGGTTWAPVFRAIRENNGTGPGALIEADLTRFVGHEAVRVRFRFRATPPWGQIVIDQVHVFTTINDSAMLDVAPDAGTLQPGESVTVQATFDARTVNQPGVYREAIRVAEDTPYAFPFGEIEAVMTVTPPASYGAIVGRINGWGHCDSSAAPVANAIIEIRDDGGRVMTTASDENGQYRYWLEATTGPFTVTVNAIDHLSQTVEIELAAGEEHARDIDLRLLAPCLAIDPSPIEATVAPGQGAMRTIDLLNGGASGADWVLRAGGDPQVLTPVTITQTLLPTPEEFMSFACLDTGTGFTLDNRYLRIFPMADRGSPDSSRQIHGITFGIERALSVAGSQPVSVRLHRLDGPLTIANMSLLAEATIGVTDTQLSRLSVAFDQPVTVDADAILVAELHLPADLEGNSFMPGTSTGGETAPAYHAAEGCGYVEPLSFGDIGMDWMHLILELDVLASDPCGAAAVPVDWLSFDPSVGYLAGDSIAALGAIFDPGASATGTLSGSACLADAGEPAAWMAVPARLHVKDDADAIFANGFE